MAPLLVEDPELIDESLDSLPTPRTVPVEVATHVIRGTSTLGAAVFIERGTSFLANILAVRLAGPTVFGAYSLGVTTANNISTYAAGGIGTTATRFSGKYTYEGGSYRVFAQVMATISLISAALAAFALFLGAAPIARLLHRPDLTGLLQWAGITAAGMVLLECLRGFFVGQRRLLALAVLSIMVGLGMLCCMPLVALTHKPAAMVISHGAITLTAVTVCCVMAARLHLMPPSGGAPGINFMALLREVWSYGLIQLSGLVSANVAGWWVTALVARGDSTLVQISFFAIASQMRNLIGLVPSLLTEGSFAAMATTEDQDASVPHRVMMLCTFASIGVSFLIAAGTAIVAPFILRLVYGPAYATAALAVSVGVGVAVIQMGNAPPSARLSVISIRSTAFVNTVWALFTGAAGTLLMLHGGTAAGAMAVFLVAHVLIAAMVLVALSRRDQLPAGMVPLFLISTIGIILLALLASYRAGHPTSPALPSFAMLAVTAICTAAMYRLGKTHRCLPTRDMLRGLVRRMDGMFRLLRFLPVRRER